MPRDDGRGPDARLPSIRSCFLGKYGLWSGVHTTLPRRGGGGGGTGPFGDTQLCHFGGRWSRRRRSHHPILATPDPFRLGVLLYDNRRLFFSSSKFETRLSNPFFVSVSPSHPSLFYVPGTCGGERDARHRLSLTEARHHHQVKVHPRHATAGDGGRVPG